MSKQIINDKLGEAKRELEHIKGLLTVSNKSKAIKAIKKIKKVIESKNEFKYPFCNLRLFEIREIINEVENV